MDSNELHDWMIQAFGNAQGEQAWQQFQMLPDAMKDQVLSQPASSLPPASQIGSLFTALSNSQAAQGTTDPSSPLDQGIVSSIAHSLVQHTNTSHDSTSSASQTSTPQIASTAHLPAPTKEQYANTISTASLWLDAATSMNPPSGTPLLLSRDQWIDATIPNWVKLANPVARQTIAALRSVFIERFGQDSNFETSAGLLAGPVPITLPDNLRDPKKMIEMVGATSFSMQLGKTAGTLAQSVFSGFDQGIALIDHAAGAILPENIDAYASSIELPQSEVASYLILRELASARLYASTPWLMPQIQALVDKYARGISIDVDAIEDQLRQSSSLSPDGISGAVDISNIAMSESDEQKEAKRSLERILATIEGWIDCVTWQASQAYLPHISQLREMLRRRKAVGGPDEQTFQALLGLEIHPVQAREACHVWEKLTASEGLEGRDAHWKHPDLLPQLPEQTSGTHEASSPAGTPTSSADTQTDQSQQADQHNQSGNSSSSQSSQSQKKDSIDWDAALDQLLDEEAHRGDQGNKEDKGNKKDQGNDSDHQPDQDKPDQQK